MSARAFLLIVSTALFTLSAKAEELTNPEVLPPGALVSPVPAAAPEPSTWALLALDFAGLGYAGHRRSKRGCSRHPA
jgi:hypothetical protein